MVEMIEARILLSPHEHAKIHVIHCTDINSYISIGRKRAWQIYAPTTRWSFLRMFVTVAFLLCRIFKSWKVEARAKNFVTMDFKVWAAHKIMTKQSKLID